MPIWVMVDSFCSKIGLTIYRSRQQIIVWLLFPKILPLYHSSLPECSMRSQMFHEKRKSCANNEHTDWFKDNLEGSEGVKITLRWRKALIKTGPPTPHVFFLHFEFNFYIQNDSKFPPYSLKFRFMHLFLLVP